ncbi:MAG: lipase [Firmicutes bacterium]|nr:lipase [Bacillota bacterium]
MGKIVCFGDSNTYGYDPVTMRYGAADRWVDLLAGMQAREVINMGQNGRTIPDGSFAERLSGVMESGDRLLIMLGSNDLLLEGKPAAVAAARMEDFLLALQATFAYEAPKAKAGPEIILISPPPMKRGFWVTDDNTVEESYKVAGLYKALADKMNIGFADAGTWGVELTCDGVHFTETGHHKFAEGIYKHLSL